MKRMETRPVEKTVILGPPAIGSMKTNDDDSATQSSMTTGENPAFAAAATTIGPKMAAVAMLDTTSVTKQTTSVMTKSSAAWPRPRLHRQSAITPAKPERTVPCATM